MLCNNNQNNAVDFFFKNEESIKRFVLWKMGAKGERDYETLSSLPKKQRHMRIWMEYHVFFSNEKGIKSIESYTPTTSNRTVSVQSYKIQSFIIIIWLVLLSSNLCQNLWIIDLVRQGPIYFHDSPISQAITPSICGKSKFSRGLLNSSSGNSSKNITYFISRSKHVVSMTHRIPSSLQHFFQRISLNELINHKANSFKIIIRFSWNSEKIIIANKNPIQTSMTQCDKIQ